MEDAVVAGGVNLEDRPVACGTARPDRAKEVPCRVPDQPLRRTSVGTGEAVEHAVVACGIDPEHIPAAGSAAARRSGAIEVSCGVQDHPGIGSLPATERMK